MELGNEEQKQELLDLIGDVNECIGMENAYKFDVRDNGDDALAAVADKVKKQRSDIVNKVGADPLKDLHSKNAAKNTKKLSRNEKKDVQTERKLKLMEESNAVLKQFVIGDDKYTGHMVQWLSKKYAGKPEEFTYRDLVDKYEKQTVIEMKRVESNKEKGVTERELDKQIERFLKYLEYKEQRENQ